MGWTTILMFRFMAFAYAFMTNAFPYKRRTIYLTENGILFPYVVAVIKVKTQLRLEMLL